MNNVRVRLPRKLAKSVSGGVLAEEGRLNPVGALGITLNMLPVHRVNMTLSEKDLPLAMHDLVEVYNHKGSVGIYRVTKIPHTIGKNRKYELSHGLDVFSDATFDMIEEYKGTVAGMLAKIINAQTQKIGNTKYWQLGTCADPNPWNKNIKYDNLMECLTEIAKKEEDYMFTFDQSTFPWTLNFVARDSTVLSEFRLNRNTENCVITEDDADLCTRLYLSVTSETNDDEGHGTYINEGYFTYNDTDAQNAGFGVVCKTAGVNQEDFTSQAALEAWVAAYFGRHNRPGVQITIDGVELNKLTGESIDEVHLARICRVALPEYSCTFNERIVSVNYPDALRKPLYVRSSLANKRQTAEDAFSEIKNTATSASKSAGGAGRAAHNDATYFRRTIGDTANGLYSRIEQTAYYIRAEVFDTANGLYSRIEETASYIRAEVADTANGLRSEIEQTASHILAEVSDTANGLYSKIEETASYIRSEVADTANGLNSKIDQTASYIRSEVSDTANGLNSKIDQTASYIRSEVASTANGLSSRIDQNASQIALRVAKGDVATQLAVEAGNVTISGGNLVIDGYITSSGLATEIGNISVLSVQAIALSGGLSSASGDIRTGGTVAGAQLYRGATDMGNAFVALSDPGYTDNSKTITFTKANGETETVTFSRAIDPNPDWSWINGHASVTLQPQNQTFTSPTALGVAADTVNHTVKTAVGGEASLEITCEKVSIVYSAANHNYAYVFQSKAGSSVVAATSGTTETEAYDAGVTAGKGVMGVTADTTNHTVKVAESSTKSLAITCEKVSVVYSTANHNYAYVFQSKAGTSVVASTSGTTGTEAYDAGVTAGEGKFSLASVTLQGTGGYVTAINANAGLKVKSAVKYNAGSDYTLYEAGSSFSYNDVGSTTVYTRSNRMALKYVGTISGQTGVFYKVDASGTNYYQTSEYTPAKRTGTRIGSKVTGTNLGSQVAVYVSASDGTQYYQAGATSYLYSAGSTVSNKYYTKSA